MKRFRQSTSSTKKVDASKRNFNSNIKVEEDVASQKDKGKHFALTNQEKVKKLKKTFPPSKTISHEYLKFEREKMIPNMKMKTQNQIDFKTKIQTFKQEMVPI